MSLPYTFTAGTLILAAQMNENLTYLDDKPSGVPFSIPISFLPAPTNNEVMVYYAFIEDVTFPANFSGSRGRAGANATATTTFNVYKNPTFTAGVITGGTVVGTVAYSTGGAFAFATTGGAAQSFSIGDSLAVAAPAVADATATGTFTLKGVR
jgi:hypothetical protein